MSKQKFWVTSDEHYFHRKIIKYCNRPFDNVEEMDEQIIKRNNEVVRNNDIVYHIGDFTLLKDFKFIKNNYIDRLNGQHYFIKGSHDTWLNGTSTKTIYEKKFGNNYIVMCHYAMLVWPRSHYNSWNLFGHSHGQFTRTQGKQMDVGVDTHNFYPFELDEIIEIMKNKPDNFNLVKKVF